MFTDLTDDELDDQLEDDDYDLLEENLGVKVQRVSSIMLEIIRQSHEVQLVSCYLQKKFKRLRRVDDDDDSDEEGENHEEQEDRQAIANELFEGSDDEGEKGSVQETEQKPPENEYGNLSDSEMESGWFFSLFN